MIKPLIIEPDIYLYNEDCLEGIKNIESNSIPLIICDPPFGLEAHETQTYHEKKHNLIIPGYVEAPSGSDEYYAFSYDWLSQVKRVLTRTGSLYVFSGWRFGYLIRTALEQLNFRVINEIVYRRYELRFKKKKYIDSHGYIYFCSYDNDAKYAFNNRCRFSRADMTPDGKSIEHQDLVDIWQMPKQSSKNKVRNRFNQSQYMLEKIIQYSSNQGDMILDMFLGGFNTAICARRLGRKIIGFELNSNACEHFFPIVAETEYDSTSVRNFEHPYHSIDEFYRNRKAVIE